MHPSAPASQPCHCAKLVERGHLPPSDLLQPPPHCALAVEGQWSQEDLCSGIKHSYLFVKSLLPEEGAIIFGGGAAELDHHYAVLRVLCAMVTLTEGLQHGERRT